MNSDGMTWPLSGFFNKDEMDRFMTRLMIENRAIPQGIVVFLLRRHLGERERGGRYEVGIFRRSRKTCKRAEGSKSNGSSNENAIDNRFLGIGPPLNTGIGFKAHIEERQPGILG